MFGKFRTEPSPRRYYILIKDRDFFLRKKLMFFYRLLIRLLGLNINWNLIFLRVDLILYLFLIEIILAYGNFVKDSVYLSIDT